MENFNCCAITDSEDDGATCNIENINPVNELIISHTMVTAVRGKMNLACNVLLLVPFEYCKRAVIYST